MANVLPVQGIQPYHVFLKDGSSATLFPFASVTEVPENLIVFLQKLLNHEIIHGETYPLANAMDRDEFAAYWFSSFNGVMLRGKITSIGQIQAADNLNSNCLGSFYIKPNYPGHSNHICNGAFLVNTQIRNQGVGKLLGQAFLKWAPLLGYTNSVFNLVYESNRASCRLWESLGFKRLGRIPRARYLKATDEPVDAIIYGFDFLENNRIDGDTLDEKSGVVPPGHDPRLWRTKFYLANRAYPPGVNVREKSCLRTSAGSYKLVDDVLYKAGRTDGVETLKKVIIKFSEQFELATEEHNVGHSGINKTTSAIAAKYHWGTIKDTVANVIEKCEQCSQNPRSKKRNSDIYQGTSVAPGPNSEPSSSRRTRSRHDTTYASLSGASSCATSPERNAVPPPGPGLLVCDTDTQLSTTGTPGAGGAGGVPEGGGYHAESQASATMDYLPSIHEYTHAHGHAHSASPTDCVENQVAEVLSRANIQGVAAAGTHSFTGMQMGQADQGSFSTSPGRAANVEPGRARPR
ncbi:uncharacterized protein BROUX77_001995 [Berkeleyomyces rouxiae]|uniref:uncharacterized protein n=1 Tax=Berkeleyomyces rouxiae TaxID=2035830 RepID=UPI003B7A3365